MSLYVDGQNLGYVFKATRNGTRIEPVASMSDLPAAAKPAFERVTEDDADVLHAANVGAASLIDDDSRTPSVRVAATVARPCCLQDADVRVSFGCLARRTFEGDACRGKWAPPPRRRPSRD